MRGGKDMIVIVVTVVMMWCVCVIHHGLEGYALDL